MNVERPEESRGIALTRVNRLYTPPSEQVLSIFCSELIEQSWSELRASSLAKAAA
jgi:hypothetical protein